jgi:hypothetical protein
MYRQEDAAKRRAPAVGRSTIQKKRIHGTQSEKSEHNGSKRGKGAYYGRKRNAKQESNRIRRDSNKSEIREHLHLISPQ